ncbi:MAG TPA: cytochrome c maturation protein CcmE [Thermoanaerobaculia bacterium]
MTNATNPHRPRRWYLFAALGVAAAAFLVIAAGGIGDNLVYYWGPTEIHQAGPKAVGATIRLGGQVAAGSIVNGSGPSSLEFDVTDGAQTVHVRAKGVPPQMFREEIGVVLEGTMSADGYFVADKMMVSHDNNYKAPGDGERPDPKKIMETVAGNEASR